jgi:transmembrane sensor
VYRKQFEQLQLLWNTSHQLAIKTSMDEGAAWQQFKNRVTYQQNTKPAKKTTFNWMRIAAVFTVGIVLSAVAFLYINKTAIKEIAFQSLQQVVIDTLPDASVVTLNKNSTLTYPEKFKGKTRTVSLKGEAFFSITPNKEQPFVIAVNDIKVKVVGTSFNIRGTDSTTEVIVETGIVQVTKQHETIELKPGEKIIVAKQSYTLTKEAVQDKLYNYYRSKEFVCDNTPLWKLVEVLKEAYDTNIIIRNSRLQQLTLTTTFYNEPLDKILLIISETLNVAVNKEGNNIVLQ